ncbi:unnamed protein product [Caretta caretta]
MQKPQLSRQKGTVKRILYHCVAISMADSRMVLKNYKGSPMETFLASREVVLGYQLGDSFITYKSAKRRGFHCLYLMRRTASGKELCLNLRSLKEFDSSARDGSQPGLSRTLRIIRSICMAGGIKE